MRDQILKEIEHFEFRVKVTKETNSDPILRDKLLKYYDKVLTGLRNELKNLD